MRGSDGCARGGGKGGGAGSGLPVGCDGGALECSWRGCHMEGRGSDQVEWASGTS